MCRVFPIYNILFSVFTGFNTDPYNNKEISLNYQNGDYCPGHRLKSTEVINFMIYIIYS